MSSHDRFGETYRRWVAVQSIACVGATLFAVTGGGGAPARVAFFLAAWGGVAMGTLVVIGAVRAPGGHKPRRVDGLTAVRAVAAVLVLVWVGVHGGRVERMPNWGIGPFSPGPRSAWVTVALLAAVELTDYFDGRIARRRGATAFGALWDMENDSFFALALSFVAWQIVGIPAAVLLIGLMRYGYFLLTRAEGDPGGYHPYYKLFAKSTTGTLMVALIMIHAPVIPHAVRGAIVYGALGLQVISFAWDLMLRVKENRALQPNPYGHRGDG